MADKVKSKAIKRNATTFKLRQQRLEKDQWAVYTTNGTLLSKIREELSKKGIDPADGSYIDYSGGNRIPVIFVPFYIVKFLKDNKNDYPHYVSFHRKPRASSGGSVSEYGLWKIWMEGSKTPRIFLKKVFEGWGKK